MNNNINNKTILVTGGAGYIGSHTAYLLAKTGHKVIIIDKLLHNQKFEHKWATFIKQDFSDSNTLNKVFSEHNITAVMHFAAFIEVGESVKYPQRFYNNNVLKTLKLLDSMIEHNVNKFIFSSSCAVYGEPETIPMSEQNLLKPISPYGKNKLTIEFALEDYSKAYDFKYVSLRYFNASGALPEENLGEQHIPETHIIPLMIRAIKNRKKFKIFGTNHKTSDGTCLRDYIHVLDIANGHILALDFINKTGKSDAFNLGSGRGFSVKEMTKKIQEITGENMTIIKEDKRPGDPAVLLADYTKAKNLLGWNPVHSNLENILKSALLWEEKLINQNSVNKSYERSTTN